MDELEPKDTQTPSFRERMLRALEEGKLSPADEEVYEKASEKNEVKHIEAKSKLEWTMPTIGSIQELGDTLVTPAVDKLKKSLEQEDPDVRKRRNRHRIKQETAAKRIATVVVVIALLALAITGYTGYSYVKSSLDPINPSAKEIVQVEIPQGSTTKEIGNILVENKLIKNASIFNYYSKLKSYNNFQSGFYNLNQSMSVDDLAKALQESGTPAPVEPIAGKVLIIEGYTVDQIAKAVTDNVNTKDKDDQTGFSSDEFLAVLKNPDFINKMKGKYPNLLASLPAADSGVKYQLEGYLFPATYDYSKGTSMEELVEKMLAATDANLQPYYGVLATKGLNVNQLLTIASLVEKEGSTDVDRRNISSVFYNRLAIDMPLQSNIAILYAMGKLGEKTTLAEDAGIDTNINSPYNIYVHPGLMPGPVASPSLSAIDATVNPSKTEYYYFVADVTTGTVYYSANIEEHNKNVEEHVNSKLR
ncbi:periplasmic solute-binding protein [Streptococcus varani]|uniref:Endolytic murein transglycosylase n=2 Tax=Lactobacillales TaxID=186826 RepID=A0A0E4H543_9STRE|nr:endolytic transglycosylase MltG [Streptococcus varani]CQR25772.1 periplasmic solute-binding protein [Streptococcus varani]